MPTIRTRQEVIDRLSQCGTLKYKDMIDFLYSVAFLSEIPSGSLIQVIEIKDGQPVEINYGINKVPSVQEINYDDVGNGTPNSGPNFQYNKTTGVLKLNPAAPITDFRIS